MPFFKAQRWTSATAASMPSSTGNMHIPTIRFRSTASKSSMMKSLYVRRIAMRNAASLGGRR